MLQEGELSKFLQFEPTKLIRFFNSFEKLFPKSNILIQNTTSDILPNKFYLKSVIIFSESDSFAPGYYKQFKYVFYKLVKLPYCRFQINRVQLLPIFQLKQHFTK